jgi:putative DNA methylase
MTYPKRLIEVDLPIKRISDHARDEKNMRSWHPWQLHIWWARRPWGACRAVICAALWPDPGDSECPQQFKLEAAKQMKSLRDKRGSSPCDWNNGVELRHALLKFITDFAKWENSTDTDYLQISRRLTQVAHESLGGEIGTRPLLVDPFAGGGAIPLEGLRVGADAFASDLNSIPVLLNKVILEYIPRYGNTLLNELQKWGGVIEERIELTLKEVYPKDADGATPICYIWARTIRCEGPSCGAEVPLLRQNWLCNKKGKKIILKIIPDNTQKSIHFEILNNPKELPSISATIKNGSAVTGGMYLLNYQRESMNGCQDSQKKEWLELTLFLPVLDRH